MLVILYIVGCDRRRPDRYWLSNAPLDRSPRYDDHDTERQGDREIERERDRETER